MASSLWNRDMGAYLRTDTDLLLMTSTEKETEDLQETGAAGSAKLSQGQKDKDAEREAQDLKRLASEALKAMQNKTVLSADSMSKSPSTEILENYNQQPLHVRSRAEQWELPRSVSFLNSQSREVIFPNVENHFLFN